MDNAELLRKSLNEMLTTELYPKPGDDIVADLILKGGRQKLNQLLAEGVDNGYSVQQQALVMVASVAGQDGVMPHDDDQSRADDTP